MPQKRAKYITYGCDEKCAQTRSFIEGAGVILDFRDLDKNPMSKNEISKLLGHINLSHFVNPMSDSYTKLGFDKGLPARDEVVEAIANDNTLLKRPIIVTPRLITVGNDKEKISEMLQLSSNGNTPDRSQNGAGNNNRGKNGRSNSRATSTAR